MKKIFALTIIIALVLGLASVLGGCSLFGSEDAAASTTEIPSSTDEFSESTTDFAMSDTMITEEPTAPEIITTTKREMPKVTTTTQRPTETTAEAPKTTEESSTAAPTTQPTTKAEEKSTAAAKASDNLNSIVSTINSGSYTMSVGITDDKEDKVTKYVTNGNTAYQFYIPSANFNCRVFTQDGKYYMVTTKNYCELTNEQYKHITSLMGNCFNFNFSGMTFIDTGVEFYNSQLFVKESFSDAKGANVNLWFRNGSLKYVQNGENMTLVNVSNGASGSMFTIPEGFELTDYEALAQFVMTLEMFLSA